MPTLGNKRKCYVGVTSQSSTTYSMLSGETSNQLTLNNNLIEISDKDTEYQDFIGGIKGGTGSATVHADDTNENQKTLLAALEAGTKAPMFIGELGTGGTPANGHAFLALINSISETNDNGSVSSRDFSFTVSGSWTHYPTV